MADGKTIKRISRRAALKQLGAGAVALGAGSTLGAPSVWSQTLKDVTLMHVGPSYSIFPDIAAQASKDLGFKVQMQNAWTAEVAAEFANVTTLYMGDFVEDDSEIASNSAGGHFDRMVYFRIYQEILRRVTPAAVALPDTPVGDPGPLRLTRPVIRSGSARTSSGAPRSRSAS